jgi:hypothetical protein
MCFRWMKDFQDIHTFVFLFLAIGLFLSVKFFVNELRAAQASGSIPPHGSQDAAQPNEDDAKKTD